MDELDVPTRLARALKKASLSHEQFAKLSGLAQPTVSAIISGAADPRLSTVKKIDAALKKLEASRDVA